MSLTKKELQECCGLHTKYPWVDVTFAIHYNYRASGMVARVYLGTRRTPFFAGGYGYDKESAALGKFMYYYFNDNPESEAPSRPNGQGFASCEKYAKYFGYKLTKLYDGYGVDVYRLEPASESGGDAIISGEIGGNAIISGEAMVFEEA